MILLAKKFSCTGRGLSPVVPATKKQKNPSEKDFALPALVTLRRQVRVFYTQNYVKHI
jgi:hypothetical protein